MGTDPFDTSVVPAWRDAGSTLLTEPARVLLGDPCYGALEQLDGVVLDPGIWQWDVRDADDDGAPAHRVWETRLRRADTAPQDSWDWDDEYGNTPERPAAGATVAGFRGVDAGTMAWHLATASAVPVDTELLLFGKRDQCAQHEGRVLVTSTGWGDGGYPVAVRRDAAGRVCEVRIVYVTPEPSPLTADRFRELLPGAVPGMPAPEPVALTLTRHSCVANQDGDPSRPAQHSYDIVTGIAVLSTGTRFTSRFDVESEEECAPDVVRAVAHLWARVPEVERALLVASEALGEVEQEPAQGWVVSAQRVPVVATLRS